MTFENPNEKQLELSREFVEAVEKSKLETGDKANLLFTKAGLKPASEILVEIGLKAEKVDEKYLTEEEVKETIDLLKKSGLAVEIGEREFVEDDITLFGKPGEPEITKPLTREGIQAFVANSKEKLEALSKAWSARDEEAIGLALGIPRSAVEAFVSKKGTMDPDDLPEGIKNSDAEIFVGAAMSRDNWQKELKVGQVRADFMKKASPAIYKEMVERKVIKSEMDPTRDI